MWTKRVVASLLLLLLTFPASAQFVLTPGTNTAGVSASCAFGTSGVDGCGQSPGLLYAPAAGINTDALGRPNPTTKPTAAQWYAYAATSGQTWTATHPQTFNVAGVDYPTGANVLWASMTDLAAWNTTQYQSSGNLNPVATQCVFMSAKDGYNGSNSPGWTGTASSSGTTLTLVSTATGTLAVGMQLIPPGDPSVAALTFIIDNPGGGNTFTLNRSFTHATESLSATNTYFGTSSTTFQWVQNDPVLACTGGSAAVGTPASYSISGYNNGETAFQTTPVGTHGCINIVFAAIGTFTTAVTINNNGFINGATCAPIIGGTRYGVVTAPNLISGNIKVWNNNAWGRNGDPCCLAPGNQGFFVSFGTLQSNFDMEYNWMYQLGSDAAVVGFQNGNEAAYPCTNGLSSPLNSPGYVLTMKFNYLENFGSIFGNQHAEIMTLGATGNPGMCAFYGDYNTILWPSTMAAEGTATFFGYAPSANIGVLEYHEVHNNTIVSNLTGGKTCTGFPSAPVCNIYEYYNWSTDAGSPVNHIVLNGTGASCSGQTWGCTGPVTGQIISGGTGNTFNSVVGLQNLVSGSPLTGTFNAGCNAQDNASSGICQIAGNYPSLNPAGVAYGPVTNSLFSNRVTSQLAGELNHGAAAIATGVSVAAAGGPFTGTTITLAANCPLSGGLTFSNAVVTDVTQANATVGTVNTCPSSGATLTLYANAAISVANSDSLTLRYAAYGKASWTGNFLDATGAGSGTVGIYTSYWIANPAVSASTGYQSGNSGGCGTASTVSGNVELTGAPGATPNGTTGFGGGC